MPQTIIHVFREADGAVPLLDWLENLELNQPKAYAKCLERIMRLARIGYELKRPAAAPLEDGISELRTRLVTVQYRMLYFFHKNAAVLTHGFTKEGIVPKVEIERAIECRKLVLRNPSRHIASWE